MTDAAGVVPLFPLPNAVLLPRAILPLHIFEERYRKMTADTLRSHRQIAIAVLRKGWERDYYARPAIEPVVCVGTILSHEELPDGRYNLLLQGRTRARVVEEVGDEPYRQARLAAIAETGGSESDLAAERGRLVELLGRPAYAALPGVEQICRMAAAGMSTSDVADLAASTLLPDAEVALRLSLLGEADVGVRVRRVLEAVEALRPAWRNIPDDAGMN